jgi:hypothetical protein
MVIWRCPGPGLSYRREHTAVRIASPMKIDPVVAFAAAETTLENVPAGCTPPAVAADKIVATCTAHPRRHPIRSPNSTITTIQPTAVIDDHL